MNFRQNLSRSAEVLNAYFRQGLHELGNAWYGPGTAAAHPEYGMIGTKPPGMVQEGLRGDSRAVRAPDVSSPNPVDAYLAQQAVITPQPEASREIVMERE